MTKNHSKKPLSHRKNKNVQLPRVLYGLFDKMNVLKKKIKSFRRAPYTNPNPNP